MKNPLYDLIIGNIEGAVDSQTSQQETQAVLEVKQKYNQT